MKKRILTILLVMTMVCSVFLVGCEEKDKTTDGKKTEDGAASVGPGIKKFEKEGVELSWWLIGGHDEYYQYYFAEMKGLQKIQEETGIKIKFEVQTNTDNYLPMMTAKTYPDIVTAKNKEMYPGRLDQLYLDGINVAFDEYIDEYMPNFKAILENYPQISKDLQIANGKYTFASTLYDITNKEDRMATSTYGLVIRKDWLDTVGMEVPTNMDEWYDVLLAFKNMDPNGNGEPDEEPLSTASSGWKYFLTAYGIGDDPILDENGKVFYGYATPAYKEFLTEMNKWRSEGFFCEWEKERTLIDRERKVTSHLNGAWKGEAKHFDEDDPSSYISVMKKTVPDTEFAPCPWPKAEDGTSWCYSNIATYHRDTTIVTTNCKEVEAACWLIDAMYSTEGSTYLSWGIEGESYEVVNGERVMMEGMDEEITYYDTTIPKRYTYADPTTIGFPQFKEFASCVLSTKSEGYVEACEVWAEGDDAWRVPYPAQLNDAQAKEVEEVTEGMLDYISTMRKEFIEGKEPLTTYDTYVEQVKLLGSEDYERIWQECYDAYAARKAYGE